MFSQILIFYSNSVNNNGRGFLWYYIVQEKSDWMSEKSELMSEKSELMSEKSEWMSEKSELKSENWLWS